MEGYLYLFSGDTTVVHYSFAQIDFLAAENPFKIFSRYQSYCNSQSELFI